MPLERENAAKLELSKAEERTKKAEAQLKDLKSDELKRASSQKQEQTPTTQIRDAAVGQYLSKYGYGE
ncbi:hypothetical protein ATANTOWER_032177 [Ataeniobius toweri]|uniref:Uncharacterized protein n=1 Tax=Ataeniobius toweri TaxID=208326 RepID=A0ABU7A8P7_9TELE|nr:hypothetical protein [Ataeniobius toweri]